MAYFNLLRLMCSAGMLAMPLVISQMGIFMGPIITLITGGLIIGTHNLLFKSLYAIARQLRIPYVSYRYGFRIALLHGPPAFHCLGHRGPTLIAIFMVASQLGTCTVFVIFTTECLKDLMDWQSSEPALLFLFVPYLIMEYFMKNLSIISYIAMFGNFLSLAGFVIVFIHIYLDNNGEQVAPETSLGAILFGFGTLLFNLNAVGVVLSIDKSLVNTRKMTSTFGVLNVGIICPTILAAIFGSLGYYAFGTMEENVLRSLPYGEDSTIVAVSLYLISVAFAYPLQCDPAITTIIEVVKYHDASTAPSERTLKCVEFTSRLVFVTSSFIICYLIPFQAPFVGFVGNLCTTILQLVFPALMDISLRYPYEYGRADIFLIIDMFLICLGLTCFTFGVYNCGYLIYVRIMSKNYPNDSEFL